HTRFSRDWSSDVCSSDLDEIVVRLDLIEQMSRPQHADIVRARQLVDMPHDSRARRVVQANGRFVQQKQLRAMQQGASNLYTASRSEERRVGKGTTSRVTP